MVPVSMGDESGVDVLEPGVARCRGDASQVTDPGSKHRVGQQPRLLDLDKDGRVPEPGESVYVVRPVSGS